MLAYFVLPVMLLCQPATPALLQPASSDTSIELSTEMWQGFTELDQSGAYFDLVRLIYQPHQPQLKISFTNFNRALTLVRQHKADMTLAVSAHDSEQLLLSEWPIDEDQIVAIYHPQQHQISSAADLASLRLAWNLAYDFGAILGLKTQGYEVPSVAQGIELVLKQRIDVYLAELSQYDYYRQQHPGLPLTSQLIASDPIFAAFATTDKGLQLKCLWDQRFKTLAANGELQQLYQRHRDFNLLTMQP